MLSRTPLHSGCPVRIAFYHAVPPRLTRLYVITIGVCRVCVGSVWLNRGQTYGKIGYCRPSIQKLSHGALTQRTAIAINMQAHKSKIETTPPQQK